MRLIVAGGRDYGNYDLRPEDADNDQIRVFKMLDGIHKKHSIEEVVCGLAKGADALGQLWAIYRKVKVEPFPAYWRPNGVFDRGAGHARNRRMGDYATHLIAFWDGKSRGTKGMIEYMESLGKPVKVIRYGEEW